MAAFKDLFIDKKEIKLIDNHRVLYAIIAFICYVITEMGRFIYRPYIYSNNISDYGLADTIGNLGGIIVQIFFMAAVFNSKDKKRWNLIAFLCAGYILYELAQEYLPKGVCDIKDIIATLIGGIIAVFIFLIIKKVLPGKRILFKL
ncbi:VanZ family protein [Carboxylicivirga sp. N1Y90]|uniref:VanZ family protein n=1 Tax=Carboxylicivirga fragile TaxID=3417571 RepID=UPI003D332493|nr:VanZ family protein [Marinilabiliaceae bacterium N1Y90]